MTTRARMFRAAVIVSLTLPTVLLAQRSSSPVIHVWKVGSPHRGDVPSPDIPAQLDAAAHRLGFQFEMRALAAKDFAPAFFAARATNDEPDILVIDNYGHIEGITTRFGTFQGIGSDPNVAGALVKVSESLKAFQPTPWEYLIRTSKHYAEAKMLATRPIECDAPNRAMDAVDSALSKTAEQAVVAYFQNATTSFSELVDGDVTDTAVRLPHEPRSVTDVRACDWWGNDRVAFVHIAAGFEARDEIGYRTFLAAVTSVDGRPRVLMVGDSTMIIPTLQENAPPFVVDGAATAPQPPVIVRPKNGASASRMPPTTRPMLSWVAPAAAFCLVEWQYGQPKGEDWEGSGFTFVRRNAHDIERGSPITMRAPFGIGRQPHRWRIWAIGRRGDVARSPWRVLFYTN